MNSILEQINSAGLIFVEFALPMFVQSGVLILILLLTDLALRKKVRAVFRYWIWLLVLLKLVLPTSLSTPVSVGYFFGDELAYVTVNRLATEAESPEPAPAIVSPIINPSRIEAGSDILAIAPTAPTIELAVIEPGNPPVVLLSWQGTVFLLWVAVVLTMGLLLLQRAIFVRGLVAQAKEVNDSMAGTLESCRERMGVKRKIGLKISANASSPAVCGLFRPVILVPKNLVSHLNKSQLKTVLLHELAHIRRGDLWINLAQTFLQIIYFYNPLLWLANAIIRRTREQAVDEMVLVAMGEKAQQYPQTLVKVAKLAFKRPALSLRLIGVVESKSALANRIKHILNRSMPKRAKLGILGLLVVIITGAILLPMATCRPGPPSLVIKGTVIDAQTGEPIAGARVFDDGYAHKPDWEQIKADERSEWGAITNSAGQYSFLTWPEHHSIKVEAPSYKSERRSLYDGHFIFKTKNEETFDFALEPEKASDSSEFKTELLNGVTAEMPMEKANKADEDASSLPKMTFEPPEMNLKAKPTYATDEPIELYLSWADNGWVQTTDNRAPENKGKWILILRVNGVDYRVGEFPMLVPRYITAGVVRQGRHFDAREAWSPDSTKPGHIEFPPGRYRVSYVFKDVSAARPDEPQKAVDFGDIATNEVEFDVVEADAVSSSGFAAKLANGVTVELIGVCEHPSEGKQWWRPDGSKLGQRPFGKLYQRSYAKREFYELALKIENPENRKLSIIGQCGHVFNLYSDKIWGGYVLSEGKKMLDHSIGIAQGPWKTIAEANPKHTQIIGDIAFGKAFESDFEGIGVAVGVTVTYTIDKEKVDYRVIAVDQKSNIHTSSGHSGIGSSSWMQTIVHFKDLQIDEIKEFHFQTRPYEWVEFKNVSLRPEYKTDVKVEVEGARGENRLGRAKKGVIVSAKDKEQIARLVEKLKSKDDTVWKPAAEQLKKIGPKVARQVAELFRTVPGDLHAIRVLKSMATDKHVQDVMIQGLSADLHLMNSNVRHCSLIILAESGNREHVGKIIPLFQTDIETGRNYSMAEIALGQLGGDEAYNALIEGLTKQIPDQLRFMIADHLAGMGRIEAIPHLKDTLKFVDPLHPSAGARIIESIHRLEDKTSGRTDSSPAGLYNSEIREYTSGNSLNVYDLQNAKSIYVDKPPARANAEETMVTNLQALAASSKGDLIFERVGEQTRLQAYHGTMLAPLEIKTESSNEDWTSAVEQIHQNELKQLVVEYNNRNGKVVAGRIPGFRIYPFNEGDLFAALLPSGQIAILTPKNMESYPRLSVYYLDPLLALVGTARIEASQDSATDADKSQFIATLPNGVIVELIGICEHPSEVKQWWRPDGSFLQEKPYGTIKGDRVFLGANEKAYEFVVRFTGPNDVDIKWEKMPDSGGSTMTSFPHDVDGKLLLDMRVLVTRFNKTARMAQIRIGIAPKVSDKNVVQDDVWIDFKNVSLRPGVKTDVQVEVGSNTPISEAGKENKKPQDPNEPSYDGRSLTELIAALGDQDFQTRINAVYHLGYMGLKAKPAVPALVDALDEESLRESVLHSLGNIGVGAEEAIPALIKAIAEYAPACRWIAAESLAKIGKAAVPALKEAAKSEDIYLQIWCNAALAKQQGTDSLNLRYLAQLMKNDDKRTAGESVSALTMLGPISKPLVPDLIEALKHFVVPKRHIASALAQIGKDAGPAVPELTKMLKDTDLGTRADAIYALSRIGGPDVAPAVPLLIQALKTNDTPNTVMASRVRYTAVAALGNVGPDARPAIPALVIALGDKDEFVRANSAKAIGDIDPTDMQAVPALRKAMKDESGRVRVAAAQTLLKIGPVNKEVILAFIEAADDNWKGVITACETFFSFLGPQHSYVVPDLIEMLKTPSERAQRLAIRALGNMGEAAVAAMPYLIESMKNSRLEAYASGALRKLGPKAKAAVPELIKMLGDKHKRFSAASVLEAIGPQASEAIPALENCLDQSSFVQYARALLAINPKSEKAVQQLVRVAESAYVTDQWTEQPDAHYLLVKYGHEANRHIQALIDALENPNSRIRLSAAAYLGKLGVEANEAAESLGRALKDDYPQVRAEAAHAILLISLKPSERKEACNILVDLLDGKDFASHDGLFMAQVRAAEALLSLGPLEEWTVPLLITKVQDGSIRTRMAAIKAFGNIGPGAKEAIPYLKRLLKNEDWRIRHSAAQAIEKIDNKTDVHVEVEGAKSEIPQPVKNSIDSARRYFSRVGVQRTRDTELVKTLREDTELFDEPVGFLVRDYDDGVLHCIDFNNNRIVRVPDELDINDRDTILKWSKEHNIDALFRRASSLVSLSMASTIIAEPEWSELSTRTLEMLNKRIPGSTDILYSASGEYHYYAFKTSQGRIGALGLASLTNNGLDHRLLSIKYELLKPDVQVEKEKPLSLIFQGLDLTAVPHTTNSSKLPDLFEERPLGSKSYHIQKDVTAIYRGLDGTVYFIPRRNIFYVQHDKLGSSTSTYYGPFEGNPVQILNLQPDV